MEKIGYDILLVARKMKKYTYYLCKPYICLIYFSICSIKYSISMELQLTPDYPKTINQPTNTHKSTTPNKLPFKTQRNIYTVHEQNIPDSLSYHSIKLANFIQLEISDISDSVAYVSETNFKNEIKEILSRSYNAVQQMEGLYKQLDMSFMYSQLKNLVRTYGKVFLKMMDQIQKQEETAMTVAKTRKEELLNQRKNMTKIYHKQASKTEEPGTKQASQSKGRKNKLGGVHLFNENYERGIDFNLEQFKSLKQQKLKIQQQSLIEEEIRKQKEARQFKRSILAELSQTNQVVIDDQQFVDIYIRQRELQDRMNNISLSTELDDIVKFFKQSETQALSFLKESKNQQQFHQLTEGFNEAVELFVSEKNNQINQIRDKIEQILEMMNKKVTVLERKLQQRDKQVINLLQSKQQALTNSKSVSVQTYENYDDQIKQLHRKNIQFQMTIEQQKAYFLKSADQSKKEIENLCAKLSLKELSLKKTKESLQEKNDEIKSIQKKMWYLKEVSQHKNKFDPYEFFTRLSREEKKSILLKAREEGIITGMAPENQQRIKVYKSPTKHKLNSAINFQKQQQMLKSRKTLRQNEEPESDNEIFSEIYGKEEQSEKGETESFRKLPINKRSVKKFSEMNLSINRFRSIDRSSQKNSEVKHLLDKQIYENSKQNSNILDSIIKEGRSLKKPVKIAKNTIYEEQVEKKPPVFDTTIPRIIQKPEPDLLKPSKNNKLIVKIIETFKSQKNIMEIVEEQACIKRISQQNLPSYEHGMVYHQFQNYQHGKWQDQKKEDAIKPDRIENKFDAQKQDQHVSQQGSQHEKSSKRERQSYQEEQRLSINRMKQQYSKNQLKKMNTEGNQIKDEKGKVNKKVGNSVNTALKKGNNLTKPKNMFKNNQTVYKSRQLGTKDPNKQNKFTETNNIRTHHQDFPKLTNNKDISHNLKTEPDSLPNTHAKQPKYRINEPHTNSKHSHETLRKHMNDYTQNDSHSNIYQQLGDNQLVRAAMQCTNKEQFRGYAVKIHQRTHKKCNKNCRHLQRYIEIFSNAKDQDQFSKSKKVFRVPIENLNQNLDDQSIEETREAKTCTNFNQSKQKFPQINQK